MLAPMPISTPLREFRAAPVVVAKVDYRNTRPRETNKGAHCLGVYETAVRNLSPCGEVPVSEDGGDSLFSNTPHVLLFQDSVRLTPPSEHHAGWRHVAHSRHAPLAPQSERSGRCSLKKQAQDAKSLWPVAVYGESEAVVNRMPPTWENRTALVHWRLQYDRRLMGDQRSAVKFSRTPVAELQAQLHGLQIQFGSNGRPCALYMYQHGVLVGHCVYLNKNGRVHAVYATRRKERTNASLPLGHLMGPVCGDQQPWGVVCLQEETTKYNQDNDDHSSSGDSVEPLGCDSDDEEFYRELLSDDDDDEEHAKN